jgi:hypothetical protein
MAGFEVLKWSRRRGDHARTPSAIFSPSPGDEDKEPTIPPAAGRFIEQL